MTTIDQHNLQFQDILKSLISNEKHLLILGKAGTGKSSLLQHFVAHSSQNLAVVAPTGIAAINIGGETIHSFFKIKPNCSREEVIQTARRLRQRKQLYQSLQLLIIDEISMVRADLLDQMDTFLRVARGKRQPFGGVRLIMFGDLHQLPPVVKKEELELLDQHYKTPYFFSSHAFKSLLYGMFPNLDYFSLDKIYRQENKEFIDILQEIRTNQLSQESLDKLNQQVIFDENMLYEQGKAIILTTTNRVAEHINQGKLAALSHHVQSFTARAGGRFAQPQATTPTAAELNLKTGARVMFLNNDADKRWVNGHLGTITDFFVDKKTGGKGASVLLDTGKEEQVLPHTWEMTQNKFDILHGQIEREVIGTYRQLPLKLAWAVTIHKSQGKTFDEVIVNLSGGTFATGQVYVALSRATSLQGITLTRPITFDDIKVDTIVDVFLQELEKRT